MTIHDVSLHTLQGDPASLGDYEGKTLLLVNVASKCGLTPQYEGLERLQKTYGDRGFTVLGFPCNQFGLQEPGSADEIAGFCQKNYGVSFPVFAKIDVNGANTHPLYAFLKDAAPGILGSKDIKWNFTKFLINREGGVAARYRPSKAPAALAGAIEELLDRD